MQTGKTEVVRCPLHGHLTTLRHIHTSEREVFGDSVDEAIMVKERIYYHLEECTICKGPLLFADRRPDMEGSFETGELLWPGPGVLPKCVPRTVREYYRKAKLKMANDANDFAHNVRMGLEAICNNRRAGRSPQQLHQRIDALARQEGFPKLIKEMMHALRNVGNFGSHVSVRARIKPRHVPAIDMFFLALVQYVYVAQAMLREFERYVPRSKKPNPAKREGALLFNPRAEFESCRNEIGNAFTEVADSERYVDGDQCRRLEIDLAKSCRIPFAVGVSSGTMALELLLRADSIGRGQRVVTSAHTFVSVVEAILTVGAEPLLVDINPETWQMLSGNWPDDVVMVCHLYGGASPAVRSTARLLYEDASQSFGGSLEGRRLGTLTRAGAISLYPTKNLSAMGDAGVIITSDEDLACRLRALRNHGQTKAQVHEYCGTTGRLDEIQAAILCEKLKRFDSFLKARRKAARYYLEHLQDLPLGFPQDLPRSNPAPNLFVVRTEARDKLKEFLASQEITTGIHYPTPLHLMPAYRDQPWAQVSLPETERLCAEILSLPLWVGISPQQQARVVETIREFFGADGRKL